MTMPTIDILSSESIDLLKKLVKTPSLSRDEDEAVKLVQSFLSDKGIEPQRILNNLWCKNLHFDEHKPTILLNSHIDTVKPVDGWTSDPYEAVVCDGKITGLGSNDAGASLVSLLATFRYFYDKEDLPFNLYFVITCEEEVSGKNGMAVMSENIGKVDFAIVGEPTNMNLAVAEKGLIVFDCTVRGKAGHAARNEGINSIYLAVDEINKIRNFKFDRKSELLGDVKITVTQANAGTQHNVVPDICKLVIDCRPNECYTNKEIAEIVSNLLNCEVTPRSLRLNSSGIDINHPFVKRAKSMGITCFGSPTLSDQSLMHFQSVKIGPGDSARSHTANEYIFISEIENGIKRYIEMLDGFRF